jgi:hypothetical protein
MSNTSRELTSDELDTVIGGGSGTHIPMVIVEDFGGGGSNTPAGAWNACLSVFGYGPQAK